MYLVIRHDGGRIDAEELGALCARGAAGVRVGVAPRYTVLGIGESLGVAMRIVTKWRSEERARREQREQGWAKGMGDAVFGSNADGV